MFKRTVLICLVVILTNAETLYEILEVGPLANSFEIKKAFRKLSVKYLNL